MPKRARPCFLGLGTGVILNLVIYANTFFTSSPRITTRRFRFGIRMLFLKPKMPPSFA